MTVVAKPQSIKPNDNEVPLHPVFPLQGGELLQLMTLPRDLY